MRVSGSVSHTELAAYSAVAHILRQGTGEPTAMT